MTRMLVMVRTAEEAATAMAGGADRLVLRQGTAAELAGTMAATVGRCPVALWLESGTRGVPAGIDELYGSPGVLAAVAADLTRVALLPATGAEAPWEGDRSALAGCSGIALVAGLDEGRLLEAVAPTALGRQVAAARARGLFVVVAGPMEPPDVPRLLALAPDALLLDDVVRRDGRAGAPLDPARLRLLRDLIPRIGSAAPTSAEPLGPDRILVRDWIVTIPVGAYSHEGAQRVSFTVEAELAPAAGRAADLRDVVSYDLVTDAIARLTAVHVALVETLAADLADAVLAHPRVLAVDVTVEKLDLGPGRVGCRLRRGRRPEA